MMTESEAWKWLADLWETATLNPVFGFYEVLINKFSYLGLCPCITHLENCFQIEVKTSIYMIRKLDELPNLFSQYKWSPWTAEGKQQRINFCLEQHVKTKEMAESHSPKAASVISLSVLILTSITKTMNCLWSHES